MPASAPTASLRGHGREINVEQLVGKRVRDRDGKSLGRIEELIAEFRGTDWVVVEVHLGPGALLERLVDLSRLVPILGKLAGRGRKEVCLQWGDIDFADPDAPVAVGRG